MAKMGRPKTKIGIEQFEYLCSIMCTEEEIAGVFKCSVDTINNWCKENYDGKTFSEIYKMLSAQGKMSLRRYQFKMAERNPSMAIWLGKQYLGQTDKQEVSAIVSEDETVDKMHNFFNSKKALWKKEHDE